MSKRLTTPLTAIAISSGGVAVTRGGKVVPIKVMPAPGGTYGRGGGGKR